MIRPLFAALGLAILSGCAEEPDWFARPTLEIERAYAQLQDWPFEEGPVSVLHEEHGELRTYALTPCRNGAGICGTQTGTLLFTPDYAVVEGAYHGTTFYLSPGGDGWLKSHGRWFKLAWDDAGVLPPARPE